MSEHPMNPAVADPAGSMPGHQVGHADAPVTLPVKERVHVLEQRGPFTERQLARIDEAVTMASRETGLYFSVYVGALNIPTRGHAEQLHAQLGAIASRAVLVAVSPGQRVVEVVTGVESGIRLPDRGCALAVLSMTASFGAGDLTGGIVGGLRMLSDQAGRPGDLR
ncbi:MAG TPA: DUF5130 family protein [Mycobacteriales bacterium]|nr:DUF5130 family protein [Mycobacteriales bacterium]